MAMLYVHIPFCHHKCTYCGFYSVALRRGRGAYVKALCGELRERCTQKPLRTIYFGGGTPTQLTLDELGSIVETIRDCYDLSRVVEVTLEANPEDLTVSYLEGLLRLHFFNRISIGVQSFDDVELRMLNRVHTGRQARDAIERAWKCGFENISIDLIMGLPGQSVENWEANLGIVGGITAIKHVSCYELTVEEGTILERQVQGGRVCLADEGTVAAQYEALQEWCSVAGFEQYEVSNYCRPGWYSRHNSGYWERMPYIGVGASAHSFDGDCRRWNVADVERYTEKSSAGDVPHEIEKLNDTDAFNEYIMTSLRTVRGIKKGRILPVFRAGLEQAVGPFLREGLLIDTGDAYRPTAAGLLHADGIAVKLFRD